MHAEDSEIGRVVDLLVEEEHWAVRHLVVETGARSATSKILVPRVWIERVRWTDRTMVVDRSREEVERDGPTYDPAVAIKRGARYGR